MKKFFILLSLLLCIQFSMAQSQQRMYVWKNGTYSVVNTARVDSITFATSLSTEGNVTINGHEFVDLGLPSGLKWATCNVGADTPGEDGYYFAWGETSPKSDYSWDTYKWYNGSSYTKYTNDGKTTLDAADDAATQNWGDGCRMPTNDEFEELLKYTTLEWTTMYGVVGEKFTSKMNDVFVFFPASGWRDEDGLNFHGSRGGYWSGSLYPDRDYGAYVLCFYSGYCSTDGYGYRYIGTPVRAVCP